MLSINFWLTLSVAFAAGQVVAQGKKYTKEASANEYVANRFIVEFEDAAGLRKRQDSGDAAEAFFGVLADTGIDATPQLNISSSIFEGVSFTAESTTHLEDLEALPEVRNVWHARKIPRPDPEVHAVGKNAIPMWTSHENTGVLDLHKKGIQGEGATVAIVDTGIDYNHPSLGGGLGQGFKVTGGVDIVGDDYQGGDFIPDDDPADYDGHGTHVAGIVAGSNDPGFIGVAPKAKLRAYKVFGNDYPYTGDDALIKAFVTAYDDGADVINASVGSADGWTETAWAALASRLVNKGVFISISAGNAGNRGVWYPSSGSSGIDVTAVGSVTTENLVGFAAQVGPSNSRNTTGIAYITETSAAFPPAKLSVYATSLDTTIPDDACTTLPDSTPDLTNSLVLIRRGTCSFTIKSANAAAKGARYVWYYNEPNRPLSAPSSTTPNISYAMISDTDGASLINQIKAGIKLAVDFPTNAPSAPIPNPSVGGTMSPFSSWGPTWEAHSKPDISAPGGNIYSTYPLAEGGHAVLSGTSMAAPYIAGLAALYIGKAGGRGRLGPAGILELKRRIQASGNLIDWNDGFATDPTRLAPVAQQGAGYVNGLKIFYDTVISPGKLELNDTANFKPGHYVNVKNTGKKTVVYTVSHQAAGTVLSFRDPAENPLTFPPTFVDGSASAKFSVQTVSVRPGTTNSFKVTFTPPAGLDPKQLPLYSGEIVLTGNNGETLSIPYQGILGSRFNVDIWRPEDSEPYYASDETGDLIFDPHTWSMQDFDRPATVFFNRFGTQEMRWDVVETGWQERHAKYPAVEGKNKFVGSVVDAYDGNRFPETYLTRVDPVESYYFYYAWNGELTNGTTLTKGTYKFVWRVLRVGGNRNRNDNWQTVISPEFTIDTGLIKGSN